MCHGTADNVVRYEWGQKSFALLKSGALLIRAPALVHSHSNRPPITHDTARTAHAHAPPHTHTHAQVASKRRRCGHTPTCSTRRASRSWPTSRSSSPRCSRRCPPTTTARSDHAALCLGGGCVLVFCWSERYLFYIFKLVSCNSWEIPPCNVLGRCSLQEAT